MVSDLAHGVNLLHTARSKLNVGCEVVTTLVLEERALNERRLNDTLLTLLSLEQALGETGSSHSHRQSSRSSTTLGLDDLITAELHTLNVCVTLSALKVVAGLGEERNDGGAGVTTNDGDVLVGRVGALDLGDEAGGTDDVKSGDTEEALGVVDALVLEDLGGDGDGRVDLKYFLLVTSSSFAPRNGSYVLTGLAITRMLASGQESAQALAKSRTIEALVLKRSSRVIPGLRGTPAGMRTISAPVKHSLRFSSPLS